MTAFKQKHLFVASCLALFVTSFPFGITGINLMGAVGMSGVSVSMMLLSGVYFRPIEKRLAPGSKTIITAPFIPIIFISAFIGQNLHVRRGNREMLQVA